MTIMTFRLCPKSGLAVRKVRRNLFTQKQRVRWPAPRLCLPTARKKDYLIWTEYVS
jgi:hypothetical protein